MRRSNGPSAAPSRTAPRSGSVRSSRRGNSPTSSRADSRAARIASRPNSRRNENQKSQTKEIRTMRFFMYALGDENVPLPPPTPELFVEMGAFMEEATKSGALIETGGVGPRAPGAQGALADGKFSGTEGPLTEA